MFFLLGLLLVTKIDKNVPDTDETKHSPTSQCDFFQPVFSHQGMGTHKSVPVFVFFVSDIPTAVLKRL